MPPCWACLLYTSTVETLPGTAEDNKDHIKGEDKDDTEDKGDSGEETPGTGEIGRAHV